MYVKDVTSVPPVKIMCYFWTEQKQKIMYK